MLEKLFQIGLTHLTKSLRSYVTLRNLKHLPLTRMLEKTSNGKPLELTLLSSSSYDIMLMQECITLICLLTNYVKKYVHSLVKYIKT